MAYSYYGKFLQNIFTDVHANTWTEADPKTWNSVTNFLADWKASPIYQLNTSLLTDANVQLIYYLLYSRYGNSTIAPSDETRFKQRLFTIMYQYAPVFIEKTKLQTNIRSIIDASDDSDLRAGDENFSNAALNPQNSPSTSTTQALGYINNQTVNVSKKGKLNAYARAWDLLNEDVAQEFIDRFKGLFLVVVSPQVELLYGGN